MIEQQIVALDRQVLQAIALRDRLKNLVASVAGEDEPNLDDWLGTLELMTMYRKYFNDEEIADLQRRRGEKKLAPNPQWPGLIAEVRRLMDNKTPPESMAAQTLAKRWSELAQQTMGSDPRFFMKLDAMHRNEPSVQALTGVDGALIDYMSYAAFEARFDRYAHYFNPAEVERARRGHRKNTQHWQQLIAEMREQMAQGAAPADAEVRALLLRWNALFQDSWGDDPAVRQRVRAAHQAEPALLAGSGIDDAMIAFVQRGLAYLTLSQS